MSCELPPPRTLPDRPVRFDLAREYDALGRKLPTRIDWWMVARAIPGYAARFDREVPPEFVAQVADGVVDVACQCGETPRLPRWMVVVCDCNREFVNLELRVKVARPDGMGDAATT